MRGCMRLVRACLFLIKRHSLEMLCVTLITDTVIHGSREKTQVFSSASPCFSDKQNLINLARVTRLKMDGCPRQELFRMLPKYRMDGSKPQRLTLDIDSDIIILLL